ncbi:unnamed protein product [Heterobilharzia americana]|nr:unnamed protein product [Heterobilharzia americana]CAH8541535.1 unnamed protein product [Heterobilharzia americana]
MNDLSCNSICQLLCCPPLPSKIAAKLAFMPPPPSYRLSEQIADGKTAYSFALAPYLKDSFIHFVPENIESMKATTRRGNQIAILYMPINSSSKLTFLLSHGNAVDLGLMLHFMYELGTKLNVNIMCYDYSGYGMSSGKPLEKNLYADAECAFNVLRTKYSVPLNQIVLYGQSIGTVPTIHLATLHRVAAVVLHSPLMSGLRVAFPRLKRNYCCDVFSNLARTPKIISPTLVIHGTRDEVVNVNHGYRICSALAGHLLLDPLFIDGAGHNDCELFPQYLLRLTKLVTVELPQLLLNSKCSCVSDGKDTSIEPSKLLAKTTVKEDSETDLSNSDSIPAPVNSYECLSANGNMVNADEKLPESLLKPSWDILSSSKPSRLNVNEVYEVSADKNGQLNERNSPAILSSRECSESDKTGASLLAVNNNDSDHCQSKGKNDGKLVFGEKTSISKCSEIATNCSDNLVNDLFSVQPNICDLTLPPPPPPPKGSDLDFFRSSEVLWSLHSQKNGKMNTFPRKLTSKLLETEIDQNYLQISAKVWTLPREFPSEKIAQLCSRRLPDTMPRDNFKPVLTYDYSDPVLAEQSSRSLPENALPLISGFNKSTAHT